MTSFKLLGFSVLSVAVLSACSSGKGSFDLDDVEHTPSSSGSSRPTYQDVPSSPKKPEENVEEINQPALGYATEIPRRNLLDPSSHETIEVSVKSIDYSLTDLPDIFKKKIRETAGKFFDDSDEKIGKGGFDYAHESNEHPFQYVRVGYVIGANKFQRVPLEKIFYWAGQIGSVFYQGHQPSTRMPTQTATYTGYWDFVSNAVKKRTLPEDFYTSNFGTVPGQHVGATSIDEEVDRKTGKGKGHSATFSVDFGEKRLTGQLISHRESHVKPKDKLRYNVDAQIKGNRFVGSATANEKSHTIFGKDATNRLEGGFFGPKAEELAGKFLTDDNSLFVVFGAKRDTKNDNGKLETLFDAYKISTDGNELKKETMDTFGNAAYLVLDGRHFPLLPQNATGANNSSASNTDDFISTIDGNSLKTKNHDKHKSYKVTVCCSNLQYVKFGSYGEQTTANGASNSTAGAATTHNSTLTNGHLFLTGERTPMADMMKQKDKNVHYRGTWQANFLSSTGQVGNVEPGDSRNDNNAKSHVEFDVDFGGKKVSGKFFDANGTTPALTLDGGTITGNGFSGMAKTPDGGFSLDKQGANGGTKVIFTDAKVDGAFYGPNAEEIGGTITSNGTGDKVGGVFGAKRQELSK